MAPTDLEAILDLPRERLRELRAPSDFLVKPITMGAEARLSIYTAPVPGHRYVAGADTAHGIEGGDYDALVIADTSVTPVEQVAELEGHWGAERFDRLVYCMCRMFFNAFLVVERQTNGLALLRSMVTNLEYGYVYYDRDEVRRGRPRRDVLGFARSAGDVTIPNFQTAVKDKKFLARSDRLATQIEHYQFRPKRKGAERGEGTHDSDLITGAPLGENDDVCLAGAYCWKAALEMPNFEAERPVYEEGSAAATLGMANVFVNRPKAPPRTAFANRQPKGKPSWHP